MYQYKNIIVSDFYFTDSEFSGGSELTVEGLIAKEFFELDEYEIYDDEWINRNELEQMESFSTFNSDQQIVMFNWMLNQPDRQFVVKYEGESPFWFYHDCRHGEKDVSFGAIFVNAGIEEQRLWEASDIMVEKGLWHAMTTDLHEFFQPLTDEFKKRWNYYFSTTFAIKRLNIEFYGENE